MFITTGAAARKAWAAAQIGCRRTRIPRLQATGNTCLVETLGVLVTGVDPERLGSGDLRSWRARVADIDAGVRKALGISEKIGIDLGAAAWVIDQWTTGAPLGFGIIVIEVEQSIEGYTMHTDAIMWITPCRPQVAIIIH